MSFRILQSHSLTNTRFLRVSQTNRKTCSREPTARAEKTEVFHARFMQKCLFAALVLAKKYRKQAVLSESSRVTRSRTRGSCACLEKRGRDASAEGASGKRWGILCKFYVKNAMFLHWLQQKTYERSGICRMLLSHSFTNTWFLRRIPL